MSSLLTARTLNGLTLLVMTATLFTFPVRGRAINQHSNAEPNGPARPLGHELRRAARRSASICESHQNR